MSFRCLCFFVISLVAGLDASSEIRLPRILSNHAVLQRTVPIHVWGWASPGSHLTVHFHDQTIKSDVDDYGEWSAWLRPEQAGGPYELTISGDGTAIRSDILVGDVWFASGQSNMEFPLRGFANAPLKNSEQEIAAANQPRIRLLLVPHTSEMTPQPDIPSGSAWTECTPSTAANFSAVAYFFGRAIEQSKKVPIGLIDSTWGGTPADSWVSMDTLGESPALWSAFHSRALFADGESRRQELAAIQKREAAAKGTGDAAVRVPTDQLSWSPSGLYNGMIAPLTPYSIKGFLWYQGETNSRADRYRDYQALFRALIVDWRTRFRQGDLPFLFAQISSFHSPEEHWGIVRDAQRRALQLRNTAMVVTIDVGESHNVHPADKQTVGARFALAARGLVYREGMSYTSPEMRQVTSYPEGLQVWFDHAKGLASHGPLTSFEIAGENHVFVPAEAKVEGETVTVSAATILFPVYVRYAWANDDKGSLYNAAGLPVGTFTSEDTPQE